MALSEEETRAIAWQQDQLKRTRLDIALQAGRRGSQAALNRLLLGTEPLRRALQEGQNGSDNFDGYDTDQANT